VRHAEAHEAEWPLPLALTTLGVVTVLVALVSEILRRIRAAGRNIARALSGLRRVHRSGARRRRGRDGFGVVGGGKNRLTFPSALRSAARCRSRCFVAPCSCCSGYVLGPKPMDLEFWPGAVAMMLIATLTAALVTYHRPRRHGSFGVLVVISTHSSP
jgi:Ca2+:H+ antiporter